MHFQAQLENAGLGKRDLPRNPDLGKYRETRTDLSGAALKFWEDRGYGAFASLIIDSPANRIILDTLTAQELLLLRHYLVGRLAADDKPSVIHLPRKHPERQAYSEIKWKEKNDTRRLIISMEEAFAGQIGQDAACDLVDDISVALARLSGEVKRNFFRPRTPEFGTTEKANLIARQLVICARDIRVIKERAAAA